jgi:GTP cyclohydrolase I
MANELPDTQDVGPKVSRAQKKVLSNWENIGLGKLLLSLGEDLTRQGLLETPARVIRAWKEHLSGYTMDPDEIVDKVWDSEGGGDIIARNIFFSSLCEHHCLGFFGYIDVAYRVLPKRKVLGLSKIPRLIHCFSHRLQIQERLVNQIADTIAKKIHPKGLVVRARGRHLCCTGRGVRTESMQMTTVAQRGAPLVCEALLRQIGDKQNGTEIISIE